MLPGGCAARRYSVERGTFGPAAHARGRMVNVLVRTARCSHGGAIGWNSHGAHTVHCTSAGLQVCTDADLSAPAEDPATSACHLPSPTATQHPPPPRQHGHGPLTPAACRAGQASPGTPPPLAGQPPLLPTLCCCCALRALMSSPLTTLIVALPRLHPLNPSRHCVLALRLRSSSAAHLALSPPSLYPYPEP